MKNFENRRPNLEYIWNKVPPNYYQNGVKRNLLQRLWHKKKLKVVVDLIGKADPKNILDVGCASGWFLSQIKAYYPKATCSGVDVYKQAIQFGRKHYPSLKLFVADAHALPFPNNPYDVVICTEVLEHVLDPEQVIREIKRILSPNGFAIIEMDTGNLPFRVIWYWWTHMRRGVWKDSHIHSFNTQKLETLIRKNGLAIVRKKIFNASMAVAFRVEKNKK